GPDPYSSSEQAMHVFQLGGDVDFLYAGRQAIAAGDAGGAVPGQGRVFAPRSTQIMIITGVTLVAEDVGDRDVLGTVGNALRTEQTGQAPVVAREQAERGAILWAHGHPAGGADVLFKLLKTMCCDHGCRQVRIRAQPLDHGCGGSASLVLRLGEKLL